MTEERQIEIMESQLSLFDNLGDKMQYLNDMFKPDPDYSQSAINIVTSNISRSLGAM